MARNRWMVVMNRWMVVMDDERMTFPTREKAREYARWYTHHPPSVDTRLFGPYKYASGTARVVDLRCGYDGEVLGPEEWDDED